MSFDDERRAIEARFAANYSSTAVKYENLDFPMPSATNWVALSILSGDGLLASIGAPNSGSRLTRFVGIIQVDIYTVLGLGTKPLRDLADTISAIFDQVQFSAGSSGTLTCRVPSFITIGEDDGWFRGLVSVPYERSKFD